MVSGAPALPPLGVKVSRSVTASFFALRRRFFLAAFLLGATTWRIQDITRDRVIVIPAPGVPGAVPFWRGDGVGRVGR